MKCHVLLQCSLCHYISLMIMTWEGNVHSYKYVFFMFHSAQTLLLYYWSLKLHTGDFKGNLGVL